MLPTWGSLQYSQTDDELIIEAIARLITEHNDDETAHLSEGQSLQSHKASEIIDHVAGSIVEDKLADGCVTTNKLTANQIVGKDIRTAEDVGSTVDGVKFDSDGIEMWQDGIRTVNIPVADDPYFLGDLYVKRLSYTDLTVTSFFENLAAWFLYQTSSSGDIEAKLCELTISSSGILNEYVYMYYYLAATPLNFSSDSPGFEIACKTSGDHTNYVYAIMGSKTLSSSQKFIGVMYLPAVNNWCLIKSNGLTFTYTNLNLSSPYIYHKFRVLLKNSRLHVWVDDSYIGNSSTNLPTGTAYPYVTLGTCNREQDTNDFLHCNYIIASRSNAY